VGVGALLLLQRVRRVVGADGFDRAVGEARHERARVSLRLDRGVDLEQVAERRRVLVRQQQVVRRGAGADLHAARARRAHARDTAGGGDVEHVQLGAALLGQRDRGVDRALLGRV
jgi:hypothetical protein